MRQVQYVSAARPGGLVQSALRLRHPHALQVRTPHPHALQVRTPHPHALQVRSGKACTRFLQEKIPQLDLLDADPAASPITLLRLILFWNVVDPAAFVAQLGLHA